MKLLIDTLRSILANRMLMWAVAVAPEDEKTSMTVAVCEHLKRALVLMRARQEQARKL